MAGLALKGILFGVDKIPDKWFEKIPYYQSEEARKERKHGKKDRGSRRPSSVDGRARSDDEKHGRHRERRRRSQDDYNSSSDDDDDQIHCRQQDRMDYGRRADRNGRDNYHRGYSPSAQYRPRHIGDYDYDARTQSRSPHSAGHTHGYPAVGGMGGVADNGFPEHNGRPASGGYHDYRRGSGPAARGYVPYAHIYNDSSQPVPNQGHRLSRAYSPSAFEEAQPQQDPPRDRRKHERRRDERSSESYGSDASRSRRHRRHSRA